MQGAGSGADTRLFNVNKEHLATPPPVESKRETQIPRSDIEGPPVVWIESLNPRRIMKTSSATRVNPSAKVLAIEGCFRGLAANEMTAVSEGEARRRALTQQPAGDTVQNTEYRSLSTPERN